MFQGCPASQGLYASAKAHKQKSLDARLISRHSRQEAISQLEPAILWGTILPQRIAGSGYEIGQEAEFSYYDY